MAGVALGDIYLRFTWRLAGSGGALGLGLVACDAAALCVAGVALGDISTFHVAGVAFGDIHLRFTWQAWHFGDIYLLFAWQAWHSNWAGSGGALGLGLVAGDAAALCMAGVALGDIYLP